MGQKLMNCGLEKLHGMVTGTEDRALYKKIDKKQTNGSTLSDFLIERTKVNVKVIEVLA